MADRFAAAHLPELENGRSLLNQPFTLPEFLQPSAGMAKGAE
jgi:hypothetical protein